MDKESNLADHGVRKYENEVGVFTSIDPLWEQYRGWTPYHYAGNNPIMGLDWNGMKSYLITYATKDQEFGHSVFGVDEYDDNYLPTGNVILYDFGPEERVKILKSLESVKPIYRSKVVSKDNIKNLSKIDLLPTNSNSNKPDGLLELETSLNSDLILTRIANNLIQSNKLYNAESWNCSTFCLNILQSINSDFNSIEPISKLWYEGASVTPNHLYKSTKKYFNEKVLIPENKSLNNKFLP